MNNTAAVGRVESIGDAEGQVHRCGDTHRTAPQARHQRLTLDILHRDEVASLSVGADFEDGADVGVVEGRGRLCFPPQAPGGFLVTAVVGVQELDRDGTLEHSIVG